VCARACASPALWERTVTALEACQGSLDPKEVKNHNKRTSPLSWDGHISGPQFFSLESGEPCPACPIKKILRLSGDHGAGQEGRGLHPCGSQSHRVATQSPSQRPECLKPPAPPWVASAWGAWAALSYSPTQSPPFPSWRRPAGCASVFGSQEAKSLESWDQCLAQRPPDHTSLMQEA
jgi:hypothetical protein